MMVLLAIQASILGHMAKLDLLRPGTCFIEFGAGRGRTVCSLTFLPHQLLGVIHSSLKRLFLAPFPGHLIFPKLLILLPNE